METPERFLDRRDAGRHLAARLASYRASRPVVLALPRGGVPIGFEIARALEASLDVIVARKLGAPSQPELGIGAIAPGDVLLVDDEMVRRLGVGDEELEEVVLAEREEMRRRLRRYRGEEAAPDIRGRTVILTDDGLATGATARAAIASVRQMGPSRLVLAVPVCAPESARDIAQDVDDLVCVSVPSRFVAVGYWYEYFDQTSDAEVLELLAEARGLVTMRTLREG